MDELELIVEDLWNDNKLMLGGKMKLTEYIRKEREKQFTMHDVGVRSEQLKQFEVGDEVEAWGNTFAKVLEVKLTGYICEDLTGFTFLVDNNDIKDRPL